MTLYCYRCTDENCNTSFEKYVPMKDCMKMQKCPKCAKPARRDIVAEHSGGNNYGFEYEFDSSTGTRLYAASYLPHQMTDAIRRKHLGTDFILYNGAYIPRIKNRSHKLKYLKEYGNYVEF